MIRPETKLQFFKAAEALGLGSRERDLAWRRIADLGIAPDDPTVIYLAVAGVLEGAAKTIPEAINGLPSQIEAASKRAVSHVAAAASKQVRMDMGTLAEDLGRDVGMFVSAAAVKHFDAQKTVAFAKTGSSIVIGAVMIAACCVWFGFDLGRFNVSAIAAEWKALSLRADASTWFALVDANPDIGSTLRLHCVSGSTDIYIVQGAPACKVPIWLEAPVAPPPDHIDGVYITAFAWLGRYSPIAILVGGVLCGLLLRRATKFLFNAGPLAWLLDL